MNLEPRTVELSADNFNSAVETFLRATDIIKDSETPENMEYNIGGYEYHKVANPVFITIHFKQEVQQPVDHPVH